MAEVRNPQRTAMILLLDQVQGAWASPAEPGEIARQIAAADRPAAVATAEAAAQRGGGSAHI